MSNRTYIVVSRAWYGSVLLKETAEEIQVFSGREDGRIWEFSISLHAFPNNNTQAFKLELFDSAWAAMADEPALFSGLAQLGKDADVGEIEALLHSLGFEDVTETEDPDKKDQPMHRCSRCGQIEPA